MNIVILRSLPVASCIQFKSPLAYASVVAFQYGIHTIVNTTRNRLKRRYVIWYGVTIDGEKNLDIRILEVMNRITPDIWMTKNLKPRLITPFALLMSISFTIGFSSGYL